MANDATQVRMKLRFLSLSALLLSVSLHAQDVQPDAIQALGAFDQIAEECAREGSEAEVDAFRLKLWRAYLVGQGATDTSSQTIRAIITKLRSQITDDVTDELRRRYKSARAVIPDINALSPQQQHEFYELCESPRIRGTPGSP